METSLNLNFFKTINYKIVSVSGVVIDWVMLVEYRCAMQRRNTYRRREGNVYKCAVAIAIIFHLHIDILIAGLPYYYFNFINVQTVIRKE